MAVRTAGIAILRQIGENKAHRYQKEAVAVLASFLRSKSSSKDIPHNASPTNLEDIHSAFRVLMSFKRSGADFDFGSIYIMYLGVSDYDFEKGALI
jgi:hypothetical protein